MYMSMCVFAIYIYIFRCVYIYIYIYIVTPMNYRPSFSIVNTVLSPEKIMCCNEEGGATYKNDDVNKRKLLSSLKT